MSCRNLKNRNIFWGFQDGFLYIYDDAFFTFYRKNISCHRTSGTSGMINNSCFNLDLVIWHELEQILFVLDASLNFHPVDLVHQVEVQQVLQKAVRCFQQVNTHRSEVSAGWFPFTPPQHAIFPFLSARVRDGGANVFPQVRRPPHTVQMFLDGVWVSLVVVLRTGGRTSS